MKNGKGKDVSVVFVLPVLLGFLCLCLCFCFLSCKLKSTDTDTETDPAQDFSFSKIYDKEDKSNYTAVDIKQTGDGGYIILGKIEQSPYLLRIDNKGNYMWDTKAAAFGDYLGEDEEKKDFFAGYIEPVPDILLLNGEYYFFCNESFINDDDRPMALLKLSDHNHFPSTSTIPVSLYNVNIRPLRASLIPGNNILLVSFDIIGGVDLLLKMDLNSGESMSIYNSFSCVFTYPFEEKESRGYHITGTIENSGNDYSYIQSYIDEVVSFSYIEPTCFWIIKIAPPEIMTFKKNFYEEPFFIIKPFIAMELDGATWDGITWDGIKVTGARIDDNVISFFVNTKLGGVDSKIGDQQPELIASKAVYVKVMAVNSQRTVFFAGSSKDNRIVLYAYDYSSVYEYSGDKYLSKKYFGHTHIYEAAGLIETDFDEGLAILGTTFVAGRLGRICLFKLSKADLKDFVGLNP